MANIASVWAYNEIKKSGYLSEMQAVVLTVFAEAPDSDFSGSMIKRMIGPQKSQSETIRNRITELTDMGFLRKTGKILDIYTKKKVNHWRYTGRTRPLESKMEWAECSHCKGKGGRTEKVYREVPAGQMALL